MTVSSAISGQSYFTGRTTDNNKDRSSTAFQFELEKQDDTKGAVETTALSGNQTLPFSTGFSAILLEMNSKTEPQTLEEMQKALDVKSAELTAEFLTFADMSPSEKIRARLLGEMDLTEDKLAALPPEERAAIEEKIKEAIKRALGIDAIAQSSGNAEDGTAMQAM